MTEEEEGLLQHRRDRFECYNMLEKKYGHDEASKTLNFYIGGETKNV